MTSQNTKVIIFIVLGLSAVTGLCITYTNNFLRCHYLCPDPSELPLREISLSCDNLLCDGHGRPPNPVLVIHVYIPTDAVWIKYAKTEVVEVSLSVFCN